VVAHGPGPTRLASRLGGDLDLALADVGLPAWILDRGGTVRWENARATELFGPQVGRLGIEAFALESREVFRRERTKKLLGTATTSDYPAVMVLASGRHVPVEVHTVALRNGGRAVGVFGVAELDGEPAPPPLVSPLTPRQRQVLQALAAGCSTAQMAETFHLSKETVRNHVRGVLHALGVHSRLEAVVEGRRRGLVG